MNEQTCHRWRRLYGGMKGPEMSRAYEPEKESVQLNEIASRQAMDIDEPKGLAEKTGKPGGASDGRWIIFARGAGAQNGTLAG